MPRAVALLSGGLDSMLAVRIVQEHGFAVDALHVHTIFDGSPNEAAQAAAALGVALTVLTPGDDYLDLVRRPRFGYGRGMNPCIDCRIHMCRMARRWMEDLGAELVVTGEVLGQRPMSQKRPDLMAIAKHSGLSDRLLRPLSAQLLPPTLPETAGLVDRTRLYSCTGTGRRKLIELAKRMGIATIPAPSNGCALAQPAMAARLRDLLHYQSEATGWDFALTRRGRHFRFSEHTKIVLGRREDENIWLQDIARQEHRTPSLLMVPENFRGPTALVVGVTTDAAIQFAGALLLLRARHFEPANARVRLTVDGTARVISVAPQEAAASATSVGGEGS
jgi:tRNA(Ile)-lysidine synthase TilS/MesJ